MKKGDKVCAILPKSKYLTDGKSYIIQWVSCGGYIAVINDKGRTKPYGKDNFAMANPDQTR